MVQAIRIPRPARHPNRRNYAARFEQWLGYRLAAQPRRVIAALERQRFARRPPRLYLCDDRADMGIIRCVLAHYARYLVTAVWPEAQLCLVGRSRRQVDELFPRQLRKTLPQGQSQAIMATARSPEYTRGLSFDVALLLDADRYPRRGRHLRRVYASVAPCLPMHERTAFIIHGTYHPRARVNTFTTRIRDAESGHLDWPVLNLEKPQESGPPPEPPDEPPGMPPPRPLCPREKLPGLFRLFHYLLRHNPFTEKLD